MLEVIEAGGLATIQDLGRTGWRRFGVPASGPMDEFPHRAVNLLVGNPADAATLEVGGGDLMLRPADDAVIAVAGAGYELDVNVWKYPLWESYFVRGGWPIHLHKTAIGMWAYIAIAGGFEAKPVLGSRSTYTRGAFGGLEGRALSAGDVLQSAGLPRSLMEAAGRSVTEDARPGYDQAPTVDVVARADSPDMTDEGIKALCASTYRVGAASDRMGYRLEGPPLAQRGGAEMVSEGVTPGVIQVPPDGAPIVLMADSATAGGYPQVGCVIRADIGLLAQCRPGKDEVRFRQTTVEDAQAKYRQRLQLLAAGIVESE